MRPSIRNFTPVALSSAAGLLAALLLSSTASAANATLYTKGVYTTPEPANGGPTFNIVSQPGGGIYHGTHFWLADGLSGFVRLDIDPTTPGNVTQTYAGYAAGGSYAQVAYDLAHDGLYVADRGAKHSVGVVRLSFAPNERVSGACFVAPSLGGRRPSAVALGPDGNLYVGLLTSCDIVRLPVANTPQLPACQVPPVITIGKSIKGGRINGLAFIRGDLYLMGKDGLTRIANAASCSGACVSEVVAGSAPSVGRFGIWADDVDAVYYLRDANVTRYMVSRGVHEVFANSGTLPDGTVTTFTFVGGKSNLLTQGIFGNLWVGDDTSDGVGNATGRVCSLRRDSRPYSEVQIYE